MEMWDIGLCQHFYFWYICPKFHMLILNMKANFKELQVLDFGDNHLTDTFPMWLGTLLELQVLSLRSNKSRRSIRTSRIKNIFPQLRIVGLSYNVFLRSLPTCLFQQLKVMRSIDQTTKSLEYLGEGSNQDWITVATKGLQLELVRILTAYINIDLLNTRFGGHISNIVGDLIAFHILDLSHNECNVIYHQRSETQSRLNL